MRTHYTVWMLSGCSNCSLTRRCTGRHRTACSAPVSAGVSTFRMSLEGNCKYCGKPAGFLGSKHAECEKQH